MISIPLHLPTAALVTAVALLGAPAHAATPTAKPSPTRTLDVELVESGGKGGDQRVAFVISVGGEVEGWVRLGDDPRFCRVHAHEVERGARIELSVSCGANQSSARAGTDLQVKATRVFPRASTVTLGQIVRADGRSLQVSAKLR